MDTLRHSGQAPRAEEGVPIRRAAIAQDKLAYDEVDEADFSDEASIEDQDEAQAALQPAISAAASHFTSAQTPAAEKAAALEKLRGGYFDSAIIDEEVDEEVDESPENEPSPEKTPPAQTAYPRTGQQKAAELSVPPTWTPGSINKLADDKPARSHPSRSVLGSALGPTRQHRSRSAGQEALKKLRGALPSFSGHSNLFPSLPTSFFSNFGSESKSNQEGRAKPIGANRKRAATVTQPSSFSWSSSFTKEAERHDEATPLPSTLYRKKTTPHSIQGPRPPILRRVTSDESMLYHSLSRQSSLGDDNQFHDVREMVNIRFMAIKDSLPDVPNFRMPSFPKLQAQAASRMSSLSINGLFSSSSDDHSTKQRADASRGMETLANPVNTQTRDDSISEFDRALEKLTGDIVVLGGYRGSILRSAEAPHQQLWAPVKLGFNMRKANLEVGMEDEDEATMEQRIIPSGMLQHIGPVDISRKLFKKLRASRNARTGKLRVHDFGYDWRLSPALSSKRLQEFLASLPSNQDGVPPADRGALVIAHSLGGLITRHAVNNRPHLFAGVLYAGVPQRCINILGPFRNGDAVLFNEKLLTARVNFSIRTSFTLLPDDGFCFINKNTGEEYPVDFMDADNWVKWRLSPCVAPPLPPYRDKFQGASPRTSLFPNLLNSNKRTSDSRELLSTGDVVPLPSPPSSPPKSPPIGSTAPVLDADQQRSMAYLTRTLAATKKFRSQLAHSKELESANAYPPHAVLYGKTIPTVYGAQVAAREAIPCADAYDDLAFRAGDGVVLAREAMLPDGYAIVRSGRVSTERGHLTMLGDLPAVAKALEALIRGRKKGIGLGKR